MYEKVNPAHPDKIADRIAGAIVDLAYKSQETPKVAVEVLIGHGRCFITVESTVMFSQRDIRKIVDRIAGENYEIHLVTARQNEALYLNQKDRLRCGDNGIFRGTPTTKEQKDLTTIAKDIYKTYPTDGKYIKDGNCLIICQSHSDYALYDKYPDAEINPLGPWTGGPDVDSGATNRKLGSDMGDAITGGGLHGKDLSKADVSLNIYAHLKAQEDGRPVEMYCAIGDEYVDDTPYEEIVAMAKDYIDDLGGFEKFAEWGFIR